MPRFKRHFPEDSVFTISGKVTLREYEDSERRFPPVLAALCSACSTNFASGIVNGRAVCHDCGGPQPLTETD